jgi:hypothetical protein
MLVCGVFFLGVGAFSHYISDFVTFSVSIIKFCALAPPKRGNLKEKAPAPKEAGAFAINSLSKFVPPILDDQ